MTTDFPGPEGRLTDIDETPRAAQADACAHHPVQGAKVIPLKIIAGGIHPLPSSKYLADSGGTLNGAWSAVMRIVADMSELKDIPLAPGELAHITNSVLAEMRDGRFSAFDPVTRHELDQCRRAVNACLDAHALLIIRYFVGLAEGGEADPSLVLDIAMRIFEAIATTSPDEPYTRWPNLVEAVQSHYGTIRRGPFTQALADGAVIVSYRQGCLLHRDPREGPAVTVWNEDGSLRLEEFWLDGALIESRPLQGPADHVAISRENLP
jgi:hypothetical protein